jgi:hypothetical protein
LLFNSSPHQQIPKLLLDREGRRPVEVEKLVNPIAGYLPQVCFIKVISNFMIDVCRVVQAVLS